MPSDCHISELRIPTPYGRIAAKVWTTTKSSSFDKLKVLCVHGWQVWTTWPLIMISFFIDICYYLHWGQRGNVWQTLTIARLGLDVRVGDWFARTRIVVTHTFRRALHWLDVGFRNQTNCRLLKMDQILDYSSQYGCKRFLTFCATISGFSRKSHNFGYRKACSLSNQWISRSYQTRHSKLFESRGKSETNQKSGSGL